MNKNIFIIVAMVVSFVAGLMLSPVLGTYSKLNIAHEGLNSHTTHENNGTHMEHNHAMTEINPNLPVPAIEAEAIKDSKDGYNVHIETTNFAFTPQQVNMANKANEGHAHIFVNGEKLGRVYGNWHHVASDKLRDGNNEIEITLNNNDHSELTINGNHISKTLTVVK